MSKALDQRIVDAGDQLAKIAGALGRCAGKISIESQNSMREFLGFRDDIEHFREVIVARKAAADYLEGLDLDPASEDMVRLGSGLVKFRHARLLGTQSYLATSWALTDRLAGVAGRFLCPPERGMNGAKPAQLVTHFVTKDTATKSSAGAMFGPIRQNFGWAIGISYALRNHFIHEGGQLDGYDFFEGPGVASGFRVADEGWNRILDRVATYGVEPSMHRGGVGWPTAPRDDLRRLMSECEQELDDALGTLLGSAIHLLHANIGFLLGDD